MAMVDTPKTYSPFQRWVGTSLPPAVHPMSMSPGIEPDRTGEFMVDV
jgi:hypothetical protein